MSTPITACSLTSLEHAFRNWENQFRPGKPKIIQAQGSLAGKKMFPTGFWFSLSWSCWYFECFVIRYCFSSSGIMTSSATSQHRADGAAGDFILLLFSIKTKLCTTVSIFSEISRFGLKVTVHTKMKIWPLYSHPHANVGWSLFVHLTFLELVIHSSEDMFSSLVYTAWLYPGTAVWRYDHDFFVFTGRLQTIFAHVCRVHMLRLLS